MAKELSKVLLEQYPGYPWAVHVDGRPTVMMAYVENWMVAPKGYGMRVKLSELTGPDEIRRAMTKYGGELLERFSMNRGKVNLAALHDRAKEVWN